ncbi:anti-sigma regulatory factor (Ser/Thr protein kinase) [Kitasatospora sp. SolWspMP-SS2h]|uniref:ATP-binding protein n=1 Tax=Kitasatospora sp. SolWspMP-SS2h TaxID=1305729 RepID=UPI000DBAA6A1|nr:ATP-binding protein [Kitasatospora sp. SolWspMP-SS2h]RAJ45477.1 anti-sigma regulatory factor (Ser/Thr protein kinase) [Kitasatospora sp. SolWspMP-SS2h]
MPHDDARPPSPEAAVPGERPSAPVRTAGQARAVLARLLESAGHPGGRVLADAQLAVTELVANALHHGGGLTCFDARLGPGGTELVVDVEDGDDRPPVAQPLHDRDPATAGGRGWAIVQALAATCRVDPLPAGGKRIRVTFAL